MSGIIKRGKLLEKRSFDQLAVLSGEAVLSTVLECPLRGRGHQGFPVAEKWRLLSAAPAEREIVVLSAGVCAEALMDCNAEAVLAGAALSARAFGCKELWFVSEREESLPESFFGVTIKPVTIEHSMSAGEETRVFAAIAGGLPISAIQPPYPTERGLFGKPTLIHSAETFACIALILSGEQADTGLVHILGDVERPGIYEAEQGASLRELIAAAGAQDVKSLRIGGENGVYLSPEQLGTAFGEQPRGDGSLFVLNPGRCIARELYKSLSEIYRASCGKCVFCREGCYQLYLLMEDLCAGKATDGDIHLIKDLAQVIAENAACGHGKDCGSSVLSAFERFYDELEAHVRKRCAALACPDMFTVHILPDKCSGCGECMARCAAKAISGEAGYIHVVDAALCTRCMACLPCGASAIVKAGVQKPACPERPVPVGSFVQKKKGLQRRPK